MIDDLKELLSHTGLKLNLLETGCGCPVFEAFTSQDGASDYVYACYSPYSKEAQEEYLETVFDYRSVSAQFVHDACHKLQVNRGLTTTEATIDIAISMQVGKNKDNHGWICVDGTTIYHFTFGYDCGRTNARHRIVGLIEEIIFNLHGDTPEISPAYAKYIDGVFPVTKATISVEDFDPTSMPKHHAPFAIIGGRWSRLTDAFRKKIVPKFNIVKGSFNPIHAAHRELMNHFPYTSYLSITTAQTVQGKNPITTAEAVKRILDSGYNGIVDSSWVYYQNMVDQLNALLDFDSIMLYFSMGIDVFAKFTPIPGIQTHVFSRDLVDGDIIYHTSKHPELASSKIRENEKN